MFEFNPEDLRAACIVVRRKSKEVGLKFLSDSELVKKLQLSTWKRTVRRRYLPGE